MFSLARVRPIWPLLSLLVSAALLAGAHAFQRFGGLEPCPLCLDQRNWHWAVIGVSLAALVLARLRPQWLRLGVFAIALVLLGSFAQAAYHVAVEQGWLIAQCDAAVDLDNLSLDPNAELSAAKCDQIAWSLFGVSMAGYNALISLLMALASFAVAAAPRPKR
jgi:disulfide bond formation protein DsbB